MGEKYDQIKVNETQRQTETVTLKYIGKKKKKENQDS